MSVTTTNDDNSFLLENLYVKKVRMNPVHKIALIKIRPVIGVSDKNIIIINLSLCLIIFHLKK